MQVTTIGLDLAKNVFQIHGITADGTVAFNRSLRRAQMFTFFQKLEPCLIGMEACGSSHYWVRELSKLGHVVKLIAPVYVKPYVKRGKSDAADAEAICEAVTRPTMRFVEIKSRSNKQSCRFIVRGSWSFDKEPKRSTCCAVCWQSSGSSLCKVLGMPSDLQSVWPTSTRLICRKPPETLLQS